MFIKVIKTVFWGGLLCVALTGAAVSAFYYETLGSLPNVAELKEVSFETPMKIYTADHKLIGEYGESKRIPVKLEEIPLKMQQAFLAIEDSRFYEHSGIDPIGIMRAVLVAISNAEASQGASTITQQVARNFFLTRDKTLERKIREIFISLRIEQVLTKDEILELYLNKIALGHRSYGVAAAAQTYYGKDLKSLTLAEIATIAGLPKAPSTLNPISYPERSRDRRHLVLNRMKTLGYITEEEFNLADNAPYKTYFHGAPLEAYAPFVAENARQFALEKYGEKAYTDGIEIYTTVNSKVQEDAHYAIFKGVNAYDRRHGYRGAFNNIDKIENFDNAPDKISDFLRQYDIYHFISPALVQNINDSKKEVSILDTKDQTLTISWDGLKWAAPFSNDRSQGPNPKKPSDILKKGDLIYYYIDENKVLQLAQLPEAEGSLVALNPINGKVEALVGGYDFAKSKFDRTTQAKRQSGSNFKPFLYSAAVASGININSAVEDKELQIWDPGSRTFWMPKNTPNRYDGIMTLREGLARSKNVVSIRLIMQLGVNNVVEHVKKFGFEIPKSQQVVSMALGSVEVTPLTLVTGYATFANGGFKIDPYFIDSIFKDEQKIYEYKPKVAAPLAKNSVINAIPLKFSEDIEIDENLAPQVLTHEHAYIISDMLKSVIYGGNGIQGPYYGTGGRASAITKRQDLHGKTGTTNDVHDAWFSGFNGNLVATAWMGFDTDRNLGWSRISPEGGAYTALPIWAEFFKRAQQGIPSAEIIRPKNVSNCTSPEGANDLCLLNGKNLSSENDNEQTEQNIPTQTEIDTSNIDDENIF
ncbi:MAG: PBP1A family penicillin-binding protein [Succinatimonas sp.]|nr:PBP1A family penicillin-binding protein [Succinatimonas sp.]